MKQVIFHIIGIIVVLLLGVGNFVLSQDVENIQNEKPFKFHGTVGGGVGYYNSNQTYYARDPFSWNVYGAFNPSIYGFELPFSFSVTQYTKSYSEPFTQFGISPSYRWAKLHLGYRSIEFSPLVYSGTNFLGVGTELSPKWFRFVAFWGRLNKAVNIDVTQTNQKIRPQYSRFGYGTKLGVEHKGQHFSFQLFHASDKEGSIEDAMDTLRLIRPQNNTIFGTGWKFTIAKKLIWDGSATASLFAQDLGYQAIDSIGELKVPSFFQKMAPINYSSVLSFAGQTSLRLNLKTVNLGVGYRRIQPDYISLGTPYILNDVETINANAGVRMLKGKLSLTGTYNTQHNNLNNARLSTLVSHTGNLNVFAFVNKNFNINANGLAVFYFQKDGALPISDSIRLNQEMYTASLSPNYNFQTKMHQHSFSAGASYTILNDHNEMTKEQTEGANISSNLTYSIYYPAGFVGGNIGVNYSQYNQLNSAFNSIGVNIGANTQLLKEHNLALNGSVGYFFNRSTDANVNNNYSFSLGISFSKMKHRVGLSSSYIYTPPIDLDLLNKVNNVPYFVNSYNLSLNLNYSYSF